MRAALWLLLVASFQLGCDRPSSRSPTAGANGGTSPPWFEDIAQPAGVEFLHEVGQTARFFMPEILGSGAALFDFDNDGRLDILLLQNAGADSPATHRLYHQQTDGQFADVSRGSGLDYPARGMGVAVGDVNNDGLPEVVITEYTGARLFLNEGTGKFRDITREAGIDNPHWGMSASFVDYDRDGWLDLVIVNYVVYSPDRPCATPAGRPDYCGPSPFPGTVTKLFRNRGTPPDSEAAALFEDVTLASGLGLLSGPGLGVVCADFSGDHWPDIFVANDARPNHLWVNQRDGTFKEEALSRGVAYNGMGRAEANMGVALGDVDGDGLFDLFVTHLAEERHLLWKQGARGLFTDKTAASGLAAPRWRSTGFGALFADFDQDGALDLAQTNGAVKLPPSAAAGSSFFDPYRERNQVFANDGSARFRDRSLEDAAFCATAAVSRGLACGDLDGDGAPDLLVTRVAEHAQLFRNIAPVRGHWLLVRAVDPALGGRDAYGAEITVRAAGRSWWRLVQPAQSYLCSNDPRVHVGLGAAERVEEISVLWPDGTHERFPGGPVDRLVVLRKTAASK